MPKAKAKAEIWHYPGKGDFPFEGEMVWVQAVSLAPWVRAVVNGEPVGSPIRFQTESVFGGKLSTTGVAYWEGLSTHDIVLAWRRHESPDDKAEILRATEVAQRLAGKNDNYLFFMIASAFSMNPKVMKPVIEKKMARFKRRLKEVGETAFVNENTPVVDTYCGNGKSTLTLLAIAKKAGCLEEVLRELKNRAGDDDDGN